MKSPFAFVSLGSLVFTLSACGNATCRRNRIGELFPQFDFTPCCS